MFLLSSEMKAMHFTRKHSKTDQACDILSIYVIQCQTFYKKGPLFAALWLAFKMNLFSICTLKNIDMEILNKRSTIPQF